MIHIVFNEADIEVLKEAIALDESLDGTIKLVRDDYAVGKLVAHDDREGKAHRRNWWKGVLESANSVKVDETMEKVDDEKLIRSLQRLMDEDENEVIWIWAAQNQHDVSGYFWLISQLQDYAGRIYILYLNNLPFINENGNIFYPRWLSEIPAKEFIKAKKLARQVTLSEFELDTEEFKRMVESGSMVRQLEGGKKLAFHDAGYYDNALAKYVYGDFSRGSRIIDNFLNKETERTGDVYLLWRLKKMVEENDWEVKGNIDGPPKNFEVRNPAMPALKKKTETEETDASGVERMGDAG